MSEKTFISYSTLSASPERDEVIVSLKDGSMIYRLLQQYDESMEIYESDDCVFVPDTFDVVEYA